MLDELITRVFAARNAAHLAHWKTKSYAQHMALGSFYEDVIETLDDLVECYQGHEGLVQVSVGRLVSPKAATPDSMADYLRSEAEWIQSNRYEIAGESTACQNLVDDLLGHYQKTVYKLTFLS